MRWRKFNGESINLPIKDAVEDAIKKESEKGVHLKVCIGTDSQVKGAETEFATVIVFLREGHGDFMFIHNDKTRQHSPKRSPLTQSRSALSIFAIHALN